MAIGEAPPRAGGRAPGGPGEPPRPPRRGRRGNPQRRLKLVFLVTAMIVSVFVVKLILIQGFDPNSYAAAAKAENLVHVTLPAERGDILDRDGKPLADSVDGDMVTVDPSIVPATEVAAFASFLSQELGVDYFSTLAKLKLDKTRFQYIARQVPAALATEVEQKAVEQNLPPLFVDPDPIRDYPQKEIAANVVGAMGTDGPLSGVEYSFNKYLSGTSGSATYEVGASGTRLPLVGQDTTSAVNGKNITLTIDSDLQWYVEQVLSDAVNAYGAMGASGIVMNTKTGEILSLVDVPTFDPSDPSAAPAGTIGSAALQQVYEPGSVEKVVTISSLIDAGLATPEDKLTIPNLLQFQGTTIQDVFVHKTPDYTLAGAIANSSNIATVMLSQRFAKGQLISYIDKFGLGRKTNIGITGESAGIVHQKPSTADLARMAFGQSISVNALQMATAVNTIANGGVRVSPSLIKGTAITDSGTKVGTDATTSTQVVSKNAATQMMQIMEMVPKIAAPAAAIPGYRVAGKTGTAQRVSPDCGCYDGSRTISFAGFAPADAPQLTVYVKIDIPKGQDLYGSTAAAPVFNKIMSFALRHYGVQPTNTPSSNLPETW